MNPNESVALRMMLVDALRGHQAHVDFDSAVDGFPVDARGWKPARSPHTAWQLLEHMRIAQRDILEFSRNPKYQSPEWPEGYWPKTEAPPNAKAWDESIEAFQRDAREFNNLVQDLQNKLFEAFRIRRWTDTTSGGASAGLSQFLSFGTADAHKEELLRPVEHVIMESGVCTLYLVLFDS